MSWFALILLGTQDPSQVSSLKPSPSVTCVIVPGWGPWAGQDSPGSCWHQGKKPRERDVRGAWRPRRETRVHCLEGWEEWVRLLSEPISLDHRSVPNTLVAGINCFSSRNNSPKPTSWIARMQLGYHFGKRSDMVWSSRTVTPEQAVIDKPQTLSPGTWLWQMLPRTWMLVPAAYLHQTLLWYRDSYLSWRTPVPTALHKWQMEMNWLDLCGPPG